MGVLTISKPDCLCEANTLFLQVEYIRVAKNQIAVTDVWPIFFQGDNPALRAGVKPTNPTRTTVGCRPNTPRLQIFIRIGCVEISTAK